MGWLIRKIASSRVSPLQVEKTNLGIFLRLLHRNIRYLVIVLPMYGRSLTHFQRSHHLRSAYCLARYIDDLLDGDICTPPGKSPQQVVCQMMGKIENYDILEVDKFTQLGRYVFHHLDQLPDQGVAPSCELKKLIQYMLFDRMRMDHHSVWPAEALKQHHLGIFCSALHVTLCISGATYDPDHIIPLAQAQGCLYTIRDLKDDLERGIINIPSSTLVETAFLWDGTLEIVDLLHSDPVRQWINDELEQGRKNLAKFNAILVNHDDKQFRRALRPLVRGLQYLANKLKARYSDQSDPVTERTAYAH